MGQICDFEENIAAEYEHFEKVNCVVPAHRIKRRAAGNVVLGDVFYTSVSNNGANFSAEVSFIDFDSECIECNATTVICVQKVN